MEYPKEIKIQAAVVVAGMEPLKGLSDFLGKEIKEGKVEFRIMITDTEKGKGYIHPLGKDGATHDFDFSEYLEGGEDEINLET